MLTYILILKYIETLVLKCIGINDYVDSDIDDNIEIGDDEEF